MSVHIYKTKGTCSREMKITYEGDQIIDVQIIGGCNGNLQGISSLVKGMKFDDFELDNSGKIAGIENIEDFSNLSEETMQAIIEKAEKSTRVLEDTKAVFFEELNFAFGSDISSVVFKHCSPFAVVNGEYFIIQFLNAIVPEIQKRVKKSNAETEKKISKHINKYIK